MLRRNAGKGGVGGSVIGMRRTEKGLGAIARETGLTGGGMIGTQRMLKRDGRNGQTDAQKNTP